MQPAAARRFGSTGCDYDMDDRPSESSNLVPERQERAAALSLFLRRHLHADR